MAARRASTRVIGAVRGAPANRSSRNRRFALWLAVMLAGAPLLAPRPAPAQEAAQAQPAASPEDARFAAAHELVLAKKYPEAAAALEKFLADFPKHPKAIQARLELGAALLEIGKPAEAIAAYSAVLPETQSPDLRFQAYYGIGRAHLLLKDDVKAIEALTQAEALTKQDPQYGPAVRVALGDALFRQGKLPEALEAYSDFLARFPDHLDAARAYYGVGEINWLNGNYTEASITFRNFVDKYWRSPLASAAGVKAGDSYLALGKLEDAEFEYRRVLRDYLETPAAPQAQIGLGKISFAKREFANARSAFQAAGLVFAASGIGPEADLRIADTFRAEKNLEEAKKRYTELLVSPNSAVAREARYSLGLTHLADEKTPAAVAEFTRLSEDPQSGRFGQLSRLRLAEVKSAAGDPAAAAALIRPVLTGRADPDVRDEASLLLGEALLRTRDVAGADTELSALLKRAPQGPLSARATVLLAEARVQMSKPAEAVTLLSELLGRGLEPDTRAAALAGLGDAQIRSKQEKEGVAALREVLEKHPTAPSAASAARTLLAYYQTTNQGPQAAEMEQLLAQRYGGSATAEDTLLAQADQLLQGGKFEEARALYSSVLDRKPDRSRRTRARAGAAESLASLKKPAEAAAQLAELGKEAAAPAVLADAHFRVGRAYEKSGNAAAALAEYRAARTAGPSPETAPALLLGLGRLLEDAQKPAEAEAALRELITAHPKAPVLPEALYELAWTLLDQGKPDAARPVFVRLATDFPKHALAADAAFRVGEQDFQSGDYAAAAARYRQAAAAGTAVSDRAAYKLGWALRLSGDHAGAADAFSQVVKLAPQGPLAQESRVRAGEALLHLEKDAEALAQFEAVLKSGGAARSDPDLLVQARVGAALAYLQQGAGDKALTLATEAAVPANGWYGGKAQLARAEAVFLKEGPKAALVEFSRGASLYARHRDVAAEAWFRVAECYEKSGDLKSALAAWQRVVDSYPGTEWAARARERLGKPAAAAR